MVLTAEIQLRASLYRKDSRVGIREDYPHEDNIDWLKFVRVRKNGRNMEIRTEDVPVDRYPIKIERKKYIAYLWKAGINAGVVRIDGGKVLWA